MDDNSIKSENASSYKKYLSLLSLIEQIQSRLQWSELTYIALNCLVFFPTIFFASSAFEKPGQVSNSFDMLFILFGFVIGMMINAYWTVSSIRLQLKLKLRYFQARNLERKFNNPSESFLSDEEHYFNPQIGKVESYDGAETILYPNKGMLRMDGFIGSAKPRYLSLMIPFIFFAIYIASFYSILFFII